jgi:hypothetical protein
LCARRPLATGNPRVRISSTQHAQAPGELAHWRALTTALPDLVLVLVPVFFCCLPVTRIWPLLFLHYRVESIFHWYLEQKKNDEVAVRSRLRSSHYPGEAAQRQRELVPVALP